MLRINSWIDLLYFNSRMLLSFFIFSFKTFPEVFPLNENFIIQLWTIPFLIIKSLFMCWKAQKSFRVIFAKSKLFFCFLFGVKRFFQKPLYFLFKFQLLELVKNSLNPTCKPGPPVGLGSPIGAGLPGRTRPGGRSPSLASPLPLTHALATASPCHRCAWFRRPPLELAAEMGANR
jgi:hypothetical protein